MICHDDLFWTNVVFRAALPAVLIDWDLAKPAPRLADVARASSYWVPLIHDSIEDWGLPTERRGHRLRLLCDAYGLERDERTGLLDEVVRVGSLATRRTASGAGSSGVPAGARCGTKGAPIGSRPTCAGSRTTAANWNDG